MLYGNTGVSSTHAVTSSSSTVGPYTTMRVDPRRVCACGEACMWVYAPAVPHYSFCNTHCLFVYE